MFTANEKRLEQDLHKAKTSASLFKKKSENLEQELNKSKNLFKDLEMSNKKLSTELGTSAKKIEQLKKEVSGLKKQQQKMATKKLPQKSKYLVI
jgi:chromosome segregation ATPase